MKYQPYPPLEPEYFKKICQLWTDVILREESGTWIAAPLSAQYRTITDFLDDTVMQQELLKAIHKDLILVHVDLKQKVTFSQKELDEAINQAIRIKSDHINTGQSLHETIHEITKAMKKKIILFIEGIDAQIRNDHWNIMNELASLAQQIPQMHILVILETDITHPEIYAKYSMRNILCQNIRIIPRFEPSQAEHFMKYLSYNWNVNLTKDQTNWINANAGGHFVFIKEVYRQAIQKAYITYDELENVLPLQLRAKAIYENFLSDEKEVLRMISLGNRLIPSHLLHSKNHLIKLGWVSESKQNIDITVPFMKRVIKEIAINKADKKDIHLLEYTKLERLILNYLQDHRNALVTREEIAQTVWQNEWREKYSDWAIDQLIHKLREKNRKSNFLFEIKTKKGEGFYLIDKG